MEKIEDVIVHTAELLGLNAKVHKYQSNESKGFVVLTDHIGVRVNDHMLTVVHMIKPRNSEITITCESYDYQFNNFTELYMIDLDFGTVLVNLTYAEDVLYRLC